MKNTRPDRLEIFLIEHDGELGHLIASKLRSEGFRIKIFPTLEKASKDFGKSLGGVCLLILDTLNQPLTLSALDELPMNLSLLTLNHFSDRGGSLLSSRPGTVTLQKPFTIRELVDAAKEICYKS